MFVDLKGVGKIADPTMRAVLGAISGGEDKLTRVGKGLYVIHHWNFEFCVPEGALIKKTYSREESAAALAEMKAETWISEYGVCDSPEQFMEALGEKLEAREKRYVVSFVQMLRKEQPADGGWRWHKWGPYIGKKEPQYEYLYDEKEIDEVYTYHFYEVDKRHSTEP